ncbi:MAG: response regulator transcription factor [Bacteroidia bacterium]
MKIMLVEDEPELRRTIGQFLYEQGYVVETAGDFRKASEKAGDYDYDCVLVDLTLPGGNGLDIIRQLKKNRSQAGIIIISAKDSTDDKITGLDIGADDYLAKPFHLAELHARIKSVVRRRQFAGEKQVEFEEITLFPDQQTARVNGEALELTKKEFDLLSFLIANKNRVITKSSLVEHLWGDDISAADSFDFIYSHIKNLRKKIIDAGGKDYIRTIYGTGYKFTAA